MMRNSIKAMSFVTMLFAGVCGAQVHKPAYEGWSLLAPLPATNSEIAVAELDGKIYVIGGYPADRKTVATVQMYDSATNKWEIVAPLPIPLNYLMAAAANRRIYAIGGQSSETSDPQRAGFVNTLYEYDPAANRWTSRAPMPTPRGGGTAAVIDDKFTSLAGGLPPGPTLQSTIPRRTVGRSCRTCQPREIISLRARTTARFMSSADDLREVLEASARMPSRRSIPRPTSGPSGDPCCGRGAE